MTRRSRVHFGDFTFDQASGALARDGRKVALQPQPSRLLALLLSRAGDVVTRDEIRAALWSDTHVDFERSLNFCVAKLRTALGDDAASPRFIETVPTRGYRFIGATATENESVAPTTTAEHTGHAKGPRNAAWRRRVTAAAGFALVVASAAYAYRAIHRPPKIVVVPFHNETGAGDLDRVAKGVSDAAVASLASPERLPRLLVIGNAANLTFSFRPIDMKATGESLGAQYLLLGQLKRDDRRMRIVAHLIRVSDQTHLWAKTYDTDALDLAQQSAIAEQIAASVIQTLSKS